MKLTVGIISNPPAAFAEETLARLVALGRAIAERDCVVIAEAQPGATNPVTLGARAAGGMMVGITPGPAVADDLDVLLRADSGPAACEAEILRSSDIVVIATGSSGLTDAFVAFYDEGRPIGVLTRTRGIADAVEVLVRMCANRPYTAVLCDDDPYRLVDRLITCYGTANDDHGASAHRPPNPVTAVGCVRD